MAEEMTLQEEEPSEETAVQAEEEAVTSESDALIWQEEAESVKEEILYEHTMPGNIRMYYESEEIPFVDDETYALIKEAYEGVEYSAEFEKGNLEVYGEYKKQFWRLLQNEIPFLDRETGKVIYIKDWTDSKGRTMVGDIESLPYYFFDMNGDGLPELCMDNYGLMSVFTYDAEMEICILWAWIRGMELAGTRKGVWNPDYDTDIFQFLQLDTQGNLELDTLLWAEHADWYHYDINMVMFPNYADSEKRWEITEEMKQQGVFEESSEQWFFRITDEQFEELAKPYEEAIDQARDRRQEERYTYKALFGEYETSAYDPVDYVDEEFYAEIKDIYKSIDFTASFDPGDVTKYGLYKKKFKEFMDGERTVRIKETGEEQYIYEMAEFRMDFEPGEYDAGKYCYYFFDINGDEDPELCVTNKARFVYAFQYNEEQDQIVLWEEYISSAISLMGTQKLAFGGWSGEGMIREDENGDRVFFVLFKVEGGRRYQNDIEEYGYLVSLPEYIELRNEMIEQAIYDEADERYYFRVTEEQFEELTKDYYDARKAMHTALDEVTYTYTELFD
ncbi:MAG: hypothetical protein K2M70_12645 [Lachnospiraceae bacterium]|nr:hypothetical protein [Lachnospiraceae bacterium]